MQENNTRPMVVILSGITERQIVMNNNQYVYLDTKESVEASFIEEAELKQEEELTFLKNTQYKRDRKAEYDKLNQDEMRFDDIQNGTTTWVDKILEIKSMYPKPVV